LAGILEYIRFPMFTAEQLCELEATPIVEQHQELFQKYIMQVICFCLFLVFVVVDHFLFAVSSSMENLLHCVVQEHHLI
jgi:hypothetical protein